MLARCLVSLDDARGLSLDQELCWDTASHLEVPITKRSSRDGGPAWVPFPPGAAPLSERERELGVVHAACPARLVSLAPLTLSAP